jgi:beta-lactamase superfamily II metal-dependent hydrolase
MENKTPEAHEVEISLFGPGVGECVLVHVGKGLWVVIDSCLDEYGEPVALSYLRSLGVDPTVAVKVIVVSHWHDDHIKGMAELVRRCPLAKVVVSSALLHSEFLTLVNVMNNPELSIDRGNSGLNEMASVISALSRRLSNRESYGDLVHAIADMRIFNADGVEVWTLSPSNADKSNSLIEFAAMTNKLSTDYMGVIPAPTSNRNAVAIWVRFEIIDIILGADLEETNHQHSGWSAIVGSTCRPQGKVKIFKVPHHGSDTGHCQAVVERILENPISILTAFRRSKLPKDVDLQRIAKYSNSVYLTTPSSGKKPIRDRRAEKLFETSMIERTVLNGNIGHIRLRGLNEIKVETTGPARKVV